MFSRSPALTSWKSIPGCEYVGSMLIGPHGSGVQAIVPPSVRVCTPIPSPTHHSRDGWRHAIWLLPRMPIEYLHTCSPSRLEVVSFSRAVNIPELDRNGRFWLEKQIETRIATLSRMFHRASTGMERLSEFRTELDDLLMDAALEFGDEWTRQRLPEHPFDSWSYRVHVSNCVTAN